MNSGLSSTHVGIIHHVVMQQCEIVEHLNTQSSINGFGRITSHRITGHESQYWTYSLAAQGHVIGYGLIELIGLLGIRYRSDCLIDRVEIFLERFHILLDFRC